MTDRITFYGHPMCWMVFPVRETLDKLEIDYDYRNIYEDESARTRVREINRGYESVPTLVFPDGSTLTEPSPSDLMGKLREAGLIPAHASLRSRLMRFAGRKPPGD